MIRLRLAEKDRVRLNCPEVLTIDEVPLSLGLELDEAGSDWTSLGRNDSSAAGMRARVWVGLRLAGVDVELSDLEFDLSRVEFLPVPKEDGSPSSDADTSADSSPAA